MSGPRIALRFAIAAAVMVLAWHLLGPTGLVLTAVVVAGLIARPLMDLFADSARGIKAMALKDVQGIYYAYRGTPIGVWEDDEGHRWLRLAAVRLALPALPRDAVLQRLLPSGLADPGDGKGLCARADDLLHSLARAEQPEAVRFKNWVHKEVYLPSGAARRAGDTPNSPSGGRKPG